MMVPRVMLDDLFPRAKPGDQPLPSIYRDTYAAACCVCGRRTHWSSLLWVESVCSMVCHELGWLRYRPGPS